MVIPNKPGFIYFGTTAADCDFGVPYPTVPLTFGTTQKVQTTECADGSLAAQSVGRRRSTMSFSWRQMTPSQWWAINEWIAENGPACFCRYFDYNFGVWRVRRIIITAPTCSPYRPAGERSDTHGVPLYLTNCAFTVTDMGELLRYTVTNALTHVTTSNPATSAAEDSTYTATLSGESGYGIGTVTVTMGGEDITAEAYADGNIAIAKVTGDIVITAAGIARTPAPYISLSGSTLTIDDPTSGELAEALYKIYFGTELRGQIFSFGFRTTFDLKTIDPVEARTYHIHVVAQAEGLLPSPISNVVDYLPEQLNAPRATLSGSTLTLEEASGKTKSFDLYADGEFVGNYPL